MKIPPRFNRRITIAAFILCFSLVGAPRASAAGFGGYVVPQFESLVTIFETVFGQLIALAQPHHTVTVRINTASAAPWHADGTSASAAAINSIVADVEQPPQSSPPPVNVVADTAPSASPSSAPPAAADSVSVLSVPASSAIAPYVTQSELETQLQELQNKLTSLVYQNVSAPNSAIGTGGLINEIAATNNIDQLNGTALNNVTVNGISGLSASDIPTNIVAANYLPLAGGVVSGNLAVSGNLTVSGAQTLSGAITIPYVTATSTTVASSFQQLLVNGSTTLQSFTFGNATGTAATTTSLFSNIGNFTNAIVGALTASIANISGLTATNSTTTNATSTTLYVAAATIPLLTGTSATFSSATSTNLAITGTGYFSGNVGIGTTSPSAALSVVGNINTTGNYLYAGSPFIVASSTIGNTFIGLSAGNANVTGQGDTAIGYGAGESLTVPALGANPQNDTLIGYNAGAMITTARESTVIGANAGANMTGNGSGVEDLLNTFVGSAAGQFCTTCSGEVYVGQKAGDQTSTGLNNVMIGVHAGSTLSTASSDVYLGYFAGAEATETVGNNVVVGMGAGGTIASGNNVYLGESAGNNTTETTGKNVLIGEAAGYSLASTGITNSGGENVMIGYDAGEGASNSGLANVLIGINAGKAVTTGSSGVVLGSFAAPALTTSSSDVLIGSGAAAALTSGGGNIIIGSGAGATIQNGGDNIILGNGGGAGTPSNLSQAFIAGGAGNPINNVYFGSGYSAASPTSYTINGTGGSGTNIAGATVSLAGGMGTGSGTGGAITFQTAPAGSSGSSQNSLVEAGRFTSAGLFGIGTTSPLAKLDVAGTNNATAPLFQLSSVASFATTTEFIVNNNGNATLAGCLNYNGGTSGTCLSDERVKQDITPFVDGLQEIDGLNPVTYEYNGLAGTPNDGNVRTGLIAQQVEQVAPDLVATTSALLNPTDTAPTQLFEVNYSALTFSLINAVKEVGSISGVFEQNVIAWLGNTSNGIVDLFAQNGHFSNELCVGSTCVTAAQFQAMVTAANLSGSSEPQVQISAPTPPTISGTSTPPSIIIEGNNPATINVGHTYTDLGAVVTDNEGHSLGYQTFVNGALESQIVIDTSHVATDTIDYVSTDTWGNSATSTRTVIIEAANDNTQASTSTTVISQQQ